MVHMEHNNMINSKTPGKETKKRKLHDNWESFNFKHKTTFFNKFYLIMIYYLFKIIITSWNTNIYFLVVSSSKYLK